MFIVLRLIVKLAWLALTLWLLLSIGLFAIMWLPVASFTRIVGSIPRPLMIVMPLLPFETLWNVARAGALREGDPAPDFALPRQDKSGRVKLSENFGERPVVLVFGSYT